MKYPCADVNLCVSVSEIDAQHWSGSGVLSEKRDHLAKNRPDRSRRRSARNTRGTATRLPVSFLAAGAAVPCPRTSRRGATSNSTARADAAGAGTPTSAKRNSRDCSETSCAGCRFLSMLLTGSLRRFGRVRATMSDPPLGCHAPAAAVSRRPIREREAERASIRRDTASHEKASRRKSGPTVGSLSATSL